MIRFLRHVRRQLLSENKFSRYLLYAIGEIVLVVIGILIALQINNWNNRRILDKNEIKSYHNIRQQLTEDREEISKAKDYNEYRLKVYKYANKIIESQDYKRQDSLAMCIVRLAEFSDFHRSGNIYESLVNSGDIKLIKNDSIPNQLQKLQMTYTFVNKLEDMHWEMINGPIAQEMKGSINYSNFKPVKPEKLYSIDMQNTIMSTIYLTGYKNSVYTKALDEIDILIKLLNNELDK
jgi:hypothetical protein